MTDSTKIESLPILANSEDATKTPAILAIDPSSDRESGLAGFAEGIRQALEHLEGKFDDKIRDDKGHKEIIDRLHAEMQEYKADLVLQVLRPILLDLIVIHDNIGKALENTREQREHAPQIRQILDTFRTEIEDALFRQGVELYVSTGDNFDPRRQQAVKMLPAPTPEQVGFIVERLRPGFARGERVLRPERVAVFVKPPLGS